MFQFISKKQFEGKRSPMQMEIIAGFLKYRLNSARVYRYIGYLENNGSIEKRADNGILIRDVESQIDDFSTSSCESKRVSDQLDRLETPLTKYGFTVSLDFEDYEPDTRLYHAVFTVGKLYS
jgi:hypothetical protein